MQMEDARVARHATLGDGGYRALVLDSPGVAPRVNPGQFVTLRIPGLDGAVLRRPFSVHRTDGSSLTILYKVVGRGTEAMQTLAPGDVINLLGPLGNGFPLEMDPDVLPVLVAGGYGMAPLYGLARAVARKGVVFVGGASARDILCVEEFEQLGWQVHVATMDGSRGKRGLVTDILDTWLAQVRDQRLQMYACGPYGMLKAVGARAENTRCLAWLSLDRHMGCGVGACLACVQKVRRAGQVVWARVCKDGPVFDSRDIIWDE
jgi:dihydroorotate dehydrogenase electron transfer subunit